MLSVLFWQPSLLLNRLQLPPSFIKKWRRYGIIPSREKRMPYIPPASYHPAAPWTRADAFRRARSSPYIWRCIQARARSTPRSHFPKAPQTEENCARELLWFVWNSHRPHQALHAHDRQGCPVSYDDSAFPSAVGRSFSDHAVTRRSAFCHSLVFLLSSGILHRRIRGVTVFVWIWSKFMSRLTPFL